MKTYHYYPGCSVKGTGRAYEESLLAVADALGVDLRELEDWNCCGATAYMSIDELQSFALAGRNLALAERHRNGSDVVTPCSACFLVLTKTQTYLTEYPQIRERVGDALAAAGLSYEGRARVRHPLDVLINDVGVETIGERVKEPLEGLRVAPYYGCQIVRPYATFDAQHEPRSMDRLLEAAGATVVDYRFKTRCCGASQMGTLHEVGLELVHTLLQEAHDREADVIATVCPLCQFNLESYQRQVSHKFGTAPLPVVYFTQLLGLAFGLSAKSLGLKRSMVPLEPVLARRKENVA